ncbi:hypothetical protein [Ferrimonas kyonanensis]|uniref:hypothetical protein n=1 Tax=Ferrimonas kyonanensis TaxID=364763 RepID=UPI000480E43F|nr:hypothetical protein [Ferrimonas kyonanensis]
MTPAIQLALLLSQHREKRFTFFGLMSMAPSADLSEWKAAFYELADQGQLVVVERAPLGERYKLAA